MIINCFNHKNIGKSLMEKRKAIKILIDCAKATNTQAQIHLNTLTHTHTQKT